MTLYGKGSEGSIQFADLLVCEALHGGHLHLQPGRFGAAGAGWVPQRKISVAPALAREVTGRSRRRSRSPIIEACASRDLPRPQQWAVRAGVYAEPRTAM